MTYGGGTEEHRSKVGESSRAYTYSKFPESPIALNLNSCMIPNIPPHETH